MNVWMNFFRFFLRIRSTIDSLCELFASSDFSVEDIVSLLDTVAMQLTNGFHDRTLQMNVISMCSHLKLYANQLEAIYKGKWISLHKT